MLRSGLGVCGPVGRFKKSLIKKIAELDGTWDDEYISPVIRQTCKSVVLTEVRHVSHKYTSAALGIPIDRGRLQFISYPVNFHLSEISGLCSSLCISSMITVNI